MRRILALALALVLTLGVMGVAASAKSLSDFPDANKFDAGYTTAAEVMVGLGIIEGDEGGLRPTDTITRAEACKIICFILLGEDAGDLEGLEAETKYIDVPANEWYSMYVAYCTEKGIVSGDNGDGTGTFRPNDKITGYEFGKMCLCSIGYDSEYEGFESSIWQLEIRRLADKVGTSSNLNDSYMWGASITRQEAFQMAFDAMQKNIVVPQFSGGKMTGYTTKSSTILRDGFNTLTTDPDAVAEYDARTNTFQVDGVVVEDVPLQYIGAHAKVYYQVNSRQQKTPITGTYLSVKELAYSHDGTSVARLLDKKDAKYCRYESDPVIVFNLNGVVLDDEYVNEYFIPDVGDVVVLYDTDGNNKVDFIFMQTYKVYQLTNDAAVSGKKVTLPGVDGPLSAGVETTRVTGYNNLKKGDLVMVYSFMDNQRFEVYKLTGEVTLKLTKLGSNDPYQPYFSNRAYQYSSGCLFFGAQNGNPPASAQLNDSFVIYLDNNGYVAAIMSTGTSQPVTTPVYYGILTAYQANGYQAAGEGGSFSTGNKEIPAIEQAVIYSFKDNAYKQYDFALKVSGGKTAFVATDKVGSATYFLFNEVSGAGLTNALGGKAADWMDRAQENAYVMDAGSGRGYKLYLVEYELNSAGKISRISVVGDPDDVMTNVAKMEKGKTFRVGNVEYVGGSYKYFYITRDKDDAKKFSIKAYSGYNNAPTVQNVTLFYNTDKDLIVVETTTVEEIINPNEVEIFIRDVEKYETEKVGNKYVITVKAYVNGVEQDIRIYDDDGTLGEDEATRGFWKATVADGVYTLKSPVSTVDAKVTDKQDTFFVYEGGTPYYYNGNTRFYLVTLDTNGTTWTMKLDSSAFSSYSTMEYTILRVVAQNTDQATDVYYLATKK